MANTKGASASYSIGAVSRLTGLTTHAIRMWEHRYKAVSPRRSDSGRRIYTAAEVEKLSILKALTDRGSPISSIAGLSGKALRARLEQDQSLARNASHATISVAAMGATIPALLRSQLERIEGLDLIAAGTEPQALDADISGRPLDALLLEFPVLNRHTIGLVQAMRKQYRSPSTMVIYRFARSVDESALAAEGIVTLRNPVSGAELVAAITARPAGPAEKPLQKNVDEDSVGRRAKYAPVPARCFDSGQLARLSDIETSVDCECQRHLAEILSALTAFEIYSRNCEESDTTQAELHAYLHNATGQARGIMEQALSHLVDIEDITI